MDKWTPMAVTQTVLAVAITGGAIYCLFDSTIDNTSLNGMFTLAGFVIGYYFKTGVDLRNASKN